MDRGATRYLRGYEPHWIERARLSLEYPPEDAAMSGQTRPGSPIAGPTGAVGQASAHGPYTGVLR